MVHSIGCIFGSFLWGQTLTVPKFYVWNCSGWFPFKVPPSQASLGRQFAIFFLLSFWNNFIVFNVCFNMLSCLPQARQGLCRDSVPPFLIGQQVSLWVWVVTQLTIEKNDWWAGIKKGEKRKYKSWFIEEEKVN